MATIDTNSYIDRLKGIAANYAVQLDDIIAVPSVKEWSEKHGLTEDNPFRTARVVQNERTKGYLIVLANEITDSMQGSVLTAMQLRGFWDEVELLKNPAAFLQHLVLHELAHPLHPNGSETQCDEWAFKELEKYAA